jgi:hypothetical protein
VVVVLVERLEETNGLRRKRETQGREEGSGFRSRLRSWPRGKGDESTYAPSSSYDNQPRLALISPINPVQVRSAPRAVTKPSILLLLKILDLPAQDRQVLRSALVRGEGERVNGNVGDVDGSIGEGVVDEDTAGDGDDTQDGGKDEAGGVADDGVALVERLFGWVRWWWGRGIR